MEREPIIVGLDEAGVGSLMGIMSAAAVVLPKDHTIKDLCDSKKISEKKRFMICEDIKANSYYGIGVVTNTEIDTLGMGRCRRLVFHRALDDLFEKYPGMKVDKIIVDGTLFDDYKDIPHECIPKADVTHACVSAASIIAKTFRDANILEICRENEQIASLYKWESNKGYPSAHHREALKTHGVTDWHRKSYGPCH